MYNFKCLSHIKQCHKEGIFSWPLFFLKKLCGSFFWMGLKCLKATEPLWGGSLLFTAKVPEIPGTYLIDLRRMKGWLNLDPPSGLNIEPLDWESSTSTTRSLCHYNKADWSLSIIEACWKSASGLGELWSWFGAKPQRVLVFCIAYIAISRLKSLQKSLQN